MKANVPSSRGLKVPFCPTCQTPSMERVRREGFLEINIFPKFGFYPWECGNCRTKKLFRIRGERSSVRTRRAVSVELR